MRRMATAVLLISLVPDVKRGGEKYKIPSENMAMIPNFLLKPIRIPNI